METWKVKDDGLVLEMKFWFKKSFIYFLFFFKHGCPVVNRLQGIREQVKKYYICYIYGGETYPVY